MTVSTMFPGLTKILRFMCSCFYAEEEENVGRVRQAVDRGDVSRPIELQRIDSDGHPINSLDQPTGASIFPRDGGGGDAPTIAQDLATPGDLYGQGVPMNMPGVAHEAKVEDAAKQDVSAKQENSGGAAGPAPKNV